MSGTLYNPSRAVDGNTNPNYNQGSCALINDEAGGPNWWKVDLGQPFYVRMVIVTNRDDCCGDNLNYFYVGVTNSTADPVRGNYPLCNQYQWVAQPGARITLPCLPNTDPGQFVIIQQPSNGPGNMTLCEVEVYEGIVTEGTESFDPNLALGRTTSVAGSQYNLNRAVDGNADPDFYHGSCAQVSDGNWWRVQLDKPYRVRMVVVTNLGDCCDNSLNYFIVGITNSSAEPVRGNYPICNQYNSTVPLGVRIALQCNPLTDPGQFVIVQQSSDGSGYFLLCEFEVYGFNVTDAFVASDRNLALGRPAMYSSQILNQNNNPSHAVDGSNDTDNNHGSCAISYDPPGGPNWWRVDLGRRFRINMVAVISPGDNYAGTLDYFIVGITNNPWEPVRGNYSLCNQYNSTVPQGARITLQCNPLTAPGQFVIIQQPDDGFGELTVCEVEVYANTATTTTIAGTTETTTVAGTTDTTTITDTTDTTTTAGTTDTTTTAGTTDTTTTAGTTDTTTTASTTDTTTTAGTTDTTTTKGTTDTTTIAGTIDTTAAGTTDTTTVAETTALPTSSAIVSSTETLTITNAKSATEWKRYSDQRLIAPGVISMKKQFALHCVDECRRTTACVSINWQPASKSCELNLAVGGVVPSVSTSYPDWFWWHPVV